MITTKDLNEIYKYSHSESNKIFVVRDNKKYEVESIKPRKKEIKINNKWVCVNPHDKYELYSF